MPKPAAIDLTPIRTATVLLPAEPALEPAPFVWTRQARWDAFMCSPLVTCLVLAGQIVVMLIAVAMFLGSHW